MSYINISGTFYYLCSILDGCSRYIVNWDLRESMTEADTGDLFLESIRGQARCWTQPVAAPRVRIEKTALGEDAGLLGAARLACLRAEL